MYIKSVCSERGIRFYIETSDGRIHILNQKSLKWNLRNVFLFSQVEVSSVLKILDEKGEVRVKYNQVA